MQHVQNLGSLVGQKPPMASLQVKTFRPSVWERVRAWGQRTLTAETVAEVAFATATTILIVVLLVGLDHALDHYTIIPWP